MWISNHQHSFFSSSQILYLYFIILFTDSLPDSPMATYKPHDQFITINEPARLYCEAFVGRIELPDARQKIFWYRIFEGAQEHDIDGTQEIVTR